MRDTSEFAYELELLRRCMEATIPARAVELLQSCRAVAWIASGLSKVAAEAGRRAMQNLAGIPGLLFTPFDYCNSNRSSYLPLLVSYHGRNLDIQSAARAVVQAGHDEAVLLSGYEQTPVRNYLEENGVRTQVVAIPEHREDKRFVAVLATWASAAMGLRLAQEAAAAAPARTDALTFATLERAYHAAERRSEQVVNRFLEFEDWPRRQWFVLGGGASAPAMLAWEAMLAEGACLSVTLCDLRDFTHGRYLSILRENRAGFVILTDGASGEVGHIIKERFSRLFPVVEIESEGSAADSMCEHLLLVAFVAAGLARSLGHTIAKPPKPSFIRNWNNWGKIPNVETPRDGETGEQSAHV